MLISACIKGLFLLFRGFVGVVSQPSTFSLLELGYIYLPSGECHPVQEVDLPLWQHGEGGQAPVDYGFRFKAGGHWYDVLVNVVDVAEVFMGWEWEARILERFCTYKVNGVPGWGVSECKYKLLTILNAALCWHALSQGSFVRSSLKQVLVFLLLLKTVITSNYRFRALQEQNVSTQQIFDVGS